MKIAFVYGPMSLGARPLDFARLYDDPRGMTGSELSCVEYARAMGRRGHDVTLIVCQPEALGLVLSADGLDPDRHAIRVELGSSKLARLGECGVWDATLVWNEPDLLRGADPGAVRLVNQQLNDWTYCQPGFSSFVDVFTSPSAHHLAFIGPQVWPPDPYDKWRVLPNGCDPSLYSEGRRVPGRVLWASSPDRGLHLLLQCWPMIRERVPHATLHALYNFAPGILLGYEEGSIGLNGYPVTPDMHELGRRYRYIQYAAERLKDHGVSVIGSCSRNRVVEELNEALCLAYPCDTIRYTEGFSVTTMEACAAGLAAVISGEDALGSIYGELPSVLPTPISDHLQVFTDMVVGALHPTQEGGENWIKLCQEAGRSLAARHTWPILAERLEQILVSEKEKKTATRVRAWQKAKGPVDPASVVMSEANERLLCWGSGASHEVSKAIEKTQERGPYEVEGNPAPPGARVAEWYVNHHYFGHKTMRYWTSWDIMVGGTIYDAAEWAYLKRRYGLTAAINVSTEQSDRGKVDDVDLLEIGEADDASPRSQEYMLRALSFARIKFMPTEDEPTPQLYVHCQMGGSRSPAYAYLLLRGLHGMTREQALAEIRRTRPEYAGPENPGHHLTYLASADEAVRLYLEGRST